MKSTKKFSGGLSVRFRANSFLIWDWVIRVFMTRRFSGLYRQPERPPGYSFRSVTPRPSAANWSIGQNPYLESPARHRSRNVLRGSCGHRKRDDARYQSTAIEIAGHWSYQICCFLFHTRAGFAWSVCGWLSPPDWGVSETRRCYEEIGWVLVDWRLSWVFGVRLVDRNDGQFLQYPR